MTRPRNTSPRYSERRACPLCGSTHPTVEQIRRRAVIGRCRVCSLTFRIHPIDPTETPKRDAAQLAAIDASRVALFRPVVSRLRHLNPQGLLVDVGASSGYFVAVAQEAGWDAIGVELGVSLAEKARDLGRPVVVGNAESIPLRTGSASIVTLWDVLDQFHRPSVAINEAARILRPGGTLWARVRNGPVHEMMARNKLLSPKLSVIANNQYSRRSLQHGLGTMGFEGVNVTVSPTSVGDPYSSTSGLRSVALSGVKTGWTLAARLVALASAGSLQISPSIGVLATRTADRPKVAAHASPNGAKVRHEEPIGRRTT